MYILKYLKAFKGFLDAILLSLIAYYPKAYSFPVRSNAFPFALSFIPRYLKTLTYLIPLPTLL